jgi:hypothetical protein
MELKVEHQHQQRRQRQQQYWEPHYSEPQLLLEQSYFPPETENDLFDTRESMSDLTIYLQPRPTIREQLEQGFETILPPESLDEYLLIDRLMFQDIRDEDECKLESEFLLETQQFSPIQRHSPVSPKWSDQSSDLDSFDESGASSYHVDQ